jgi:hypothetical protein
LKEIGRNEREQEDTVTQIETNQTKRSAERAPQRPFAPAYWLIVKHENDWIEALTLDCEKAVAIFSHEDEAEMFLRLEDVGEDWRISESGVGELVSVLYGPCAGVKEVVLDPLPEMVAERTVGLVSLDREYFIECITARRKRFLFCEPGQLHAGKRGWR